MNCLSSTYPRNMYPQLSKNYLFIYSKFVNSFIKNFESNETHTCRFYLIQEIPFFNYVFGLDFVCRKRSSFYARNTINIWMKKKSDTKKKSHLFALLSILCSLSLSRQQGLNWTTTRRGGLNQSSVWVSSILFPKSSSFPNSSSLEVSHFYSI